jgi:hypothetical protein
MDAISFFLVIMRKRILVAHDSELIREQVRKIVESDQQLELCSMEKMELD